MEREKFMGSRQCKRGVGFFDASAFEEIARKDPENLKKFLRDQMKNTSVTCVLNGTNTWSRRWVRYEIVRAVLKGNGLLTVDIYGVLDQGKNPATKSEWDPLAQLGLYMSHGNIYFAEWKDGKWVKYADYASPVLEADLCFRAPSSNSVEQIANHFMRYDFKQQNGRENLPGWIETAAGLAAR